MPFVELAVNVINLGTAFPDLITGTAGTSDGWTFDNFNQDIWLAVYNTSVGALDVTQVAQKTVDNISFDDKVSSVPAGDLVMLGPWARGSMNTSANKVEVTLPVGSESDLLGTVCKFVKIT